MLIETSTFTLMLHFYKTIPVDSFIHIGTFHESTFDSGTGIGQFLTTIVLDSFTPNAIRSFGMESGNPCNTGIWQVDTNPSVFIAQFQ